MKNKTAAHSFQVFSKKPLFRLKISVRIAITTMDIRAFLEAESRAIQPLIPANNKYILLLFNLYRASAVKRPNVPTIPTVLALIPPNARVLRNANRPPDATMRISKISGATVVQIKDKEMRFMSLYNKNIKLEKQRVLYSTVKKIVRALSGLTAQNLDTNTMQARRMLQ